MFNAYIWFCDQLEKHLVRTSPEEYTIIWDDSVEVLQAFNDTEVNSYFRMRVLSYYFPTFMKLILR
jgi:hypothetical protein